MRLGHSQARNGCDRLEQGGGGARRSCRHDGRIRRTWPQGADQRPKPHQVSRAAAAACHLWPASWRFAHSPYRAAPRRTAGHGRPLPTTTCCTPSSSRQHRARALYRVAPRSSLCLEFAFSPVPCTCWCSRKSAPSSAPSHRLVASRSLRVGSHSPGQGHTMINEQSR